MIKFNNVSKVYKNGTVALKNINVEIKEGRVFGVIGINGSGKSTFLKMIQGYVKPTVGSVTVFGEEIGENTKKRVSYLPDVPFIRPEYKIKEAKDLWKRFFDDFNEEKFYDLLSFMKLDENMTVSELSKGMSEKFHLSLVLGRDADIYVIDEPIAGVDLVSRDRIMQAIFSKIGKDKTLVITTHLIDEMESLFDDVMYIYQGEIQVIGEAEAVRDEHGMQLADLFKVLYGEIAL